MARSIHREEEQRLGAALEPLRPYSLTGRFHHDKELRVGACPCPNQNNTRRNTHLSLYAHTRARMS